MFAIFTTSAFRTNAFKNPAITKASSRLYLSSSAFFPVACTPRLALYQTLYSSHAIYTGSRLPLSAVCMAWEISPFIIFVRCSNINGVEMNYNNWNRDYQHTYE